MAEKTMKVTIDTTLKGEDAYARLKQRLDNTGVSLKGFTSFLTENEQQQEVWRSSIAVSSQNLLKLQAILAAYGKSIKAEQVTLPRTSIAPLQEDIANLKARADAFKKNSREILTEMNDRLNKLQSIRKNGTTSLIALQNQAAQDEKDVRTKLAKDLLDIEEKLRVGLITSTQQAETERARLIRQSSTQINNIRRTIENEQGKVERRTALVAAYKDETARLITELDRRIALENAKARFGATSRQVIELEAANREIAIRERLAASLREIENRIASGQRITNPQGRFSNADTERLRLLSQAERELTENNTRLNASIRETTHVHRSLAFHIGEIIGIYRLYNFALNTIISSIKSIPEIGIQLEATRSILAATVGSLEGAESILANLNTEAERTGIAVSILRENFRTFNASTSLAGETLQTTWNIFTDINTVITALHLSTDKAQSVFLALSQIFNKTKVQSEELVKQLGNLLPGAFASFYQANIKVVKDLGTASEHTEGQFESLRDMVKQMANGTVFAHETVERFAKFLAERFAISFNIATQGLNANLNRLSTAFTLLGEAIYKQSTGALSSIVKTIAEITNSVTSLINGTSELSTGFKVLGNLLSGAFISYIVLIISRFVIATATIKAFGAVVTYATSRTLLFNGALSLLAKHPAIVVAGLAAGLVALRSYGEEATNQHEKIKNALDLIKQAEDDLAAARTKSTLQISAEDNPAVKSVRESLALARLQAQEDINFTKQIVIGFLRGQEAVLAYRKQIKDAKQSVKELEEGLVKVHDAATIELSIDTQQALQDLTKAAAQMRIAMLRAIGDTNEATVAQFKLTNETILKQAEDAISRYGAAIKAGTATIAEQDLVEQAQQIIDNYNVALDNIAGSTKKSVKDAKESLKGDLKAIELAFNETVRGIDATLSAATFEQENPLLAKTQRSIEQFTNFQLEQIAELEKAEEQRHNKVLQLYKTEGEIAVETNRKITESVKTNLPNLIPAIRFTETGTTTNPLDEAAKQVSSAGAKGAMQVLLAAWQDTGRKATDYAKASLQELDQVGQEYFTKMLSRFKNIETALAAYNWGPGNVEKIYDKLGLVVGQQTEDNIRRILLRVPDTVRDYVKEVINNASKEDISQFVKLKDITPGQVTNTLALSTAKAETDTTAELEKHEQKIFELKKQRLEIQQKSLVSLEQFKNLTTDIQIAEAERLGNFVKAAELRFDKENKINLLLLQREALGGNTEATRLIDVINKNRQLAIIKGSIAVLDQKAQIASTIYANEQQRIQIAVQSGALTQQKAITDLATARNAYNNVLKEEIDRLQEIVNKGQADYEIQLKLLNLKQQYISNLATSGTAQQVNQTGIPQFTVDFGIQQAQLLNDKRLELERVHQEEITNLIVGNANEYNRKVQEINERYALANTNLYLNLYQGIASLGSETFGALAQAATQAYGAQSKLARLAFAAEKAFRINSTIMATAQAIMNVYAQPGINPIIAGVLSALVAARGAAQVAVIASTPLPQAHIGLTNVPEEATYILKAGERVLAPQQNTDLTKFLEAQKTQQQKSSNVQPIRIINVSSEEEARNYLASSEGERVVLNHVRNNQNASL